MLSFDTNKFFLVEEVGVILFYQNEILREKKNIEAMTT